MKKVNKKDKMLQSPLDKDSFQDKEEYHTRDSRGTIDKVRANKRSYGCPIEPSLRTSLRAVLMEGWRSSQDVMIGEQEDKSS